MFGSDRMGCVDLSSFHLALRPPFFLLKFESTITAALRQLASQMRRLLSRAAQLFIITAVQYPVQCSLGLVGVAAG